MECGLRWSLCRSIKTCPQGSVDKGNYSCQVQGWERECPTKLQPLRPCPPPSAGPGVAQGHCMASKPDAATHRLCGLRLIIYSSEPQSAHPLMGLLGVECDVLAAPRHTRVLWRRLTAGNPSSPFPFSSGLPEGPPAEP